MKCHKKFLTTTANVLNYVRATLTLKRRRLPLQVTLQYGAYNAPITVSSGCSVQDLWDDFHVQYGIPQGSQAVVRGNNVDYDYELSAGDTVEFRKASGTKG